MHAEKHENEVLHIRFVHNAHAEESCFCTYVFFFSTIYQVSWISLAFITVLLLFYRKPLMKKKWKKN